MEGSASSSTRHILEVTGKRRLLDSDGAVFCGGHRDAANKLGGDHPGSKFRNKIVDPIEQNAQEPCGRINIHITIEYNVILMCMIVNAEIFQRFQSSLCGGWKRSETLSVR